MHTRPLKIAELGDRLLHLITCRMGQGLLVIEHRAEIAHSNRPPQALPFAGNGSSWREADIPNIGCV
jgi:hypothetical protein